MELREWELDSWDALVKETTNSFQTSILREMDQRCPQIPWEATLKRVPCIRYPTTFPEKSGSIQKGGSMTYTLFSLRNLASNP